MENYIELVKNPDLLSVLGAEKLSVGESFGLFFKEFSSSVDRRMASLSGSVHQVDVNQLRRAITGRKVNFVKNAGVEILVPESYQPGLANMMAHTKAVCEGVFLISSLKTEAVRLYDWLKRFIQNGRAESQFRWSITNFDTAMDKSERFVKGLPDNTRAKKAPLGQVYVNFEEMQEVMEIFNAQVKLLGARDPEMAARELSKVYELGQLLVNKIKSNDLIIDAQQVLEVEMTVNRFVALTNLCGAMMVLLNELHACFREQINQVGRM